ncbi:MAG: DEAD/DEAH box helicase [Candidatus Poribacteria bacterium]|nr:DEAD/DEAH box helicase [Candidatus Poribacteria bacterium]MDE0504172.1 DEAD/DEAH box helicase [Candidatus Poribacteria bacterium]
MRYDPQNPMIVQSDRSVLLEVDNSAYESARDELARFAELEKSPEHIHTYRITALSLWNAAASGVQAEYILDTLEQYTKYDVPQNIIAEIKDYISRYGRVKLTKQNGGLVLSADEPALIAEIAHNRSIKNLLGEQLDSYTVRVPSHLRGHLKQALIKIGFPVEDLAGYVHGKFLEISPREVTRTGLGFSLRNYQREAAEIFYAGGDSRGGSGVIVLPCGAGKTIVGLGSMFKAKCYTLILSTTTIAVRQWIEELHDKTNISPDDVGEYTGDRKEIRPITVTTYQILTYRKRKSTNFVHLGLFSELDWGLIIYDEVHLLPAPVFRMTAEIQARRRLGLTATLVREDGQEDDVFSLIGPKKYDVPWKELEEQGWIATAECTEIRVNLPDNLRMEYAVADFRKKFRIASENPRKFQIVHALIEQHRDDQVLVIGQYIDQLNEISARLNAPLITGQTSNVDRGKLYDLFRQGEIGLLVVSKVANFAIDLPDANVAIQISGTFGSRQEEAQRLGRILRPKSDGSIAHFYSIVTRDSRDQEFAINRQLFLTEQGYRYTIRYEDEF